MVQFIMKPVLEVLSPSLATTTFSLSLGSFTQL
jgi:hypothetical protein